MKILSVHNKYIIQGGEDVSREAEEWLLESYGHTVIPFERDNKFIKKINRINFFLNTIWSRESYRSVLQLIDSNDFDVFHVQNFFPLVSPSVHYAAFSRGLPIIQTLRNYRLLCPNGLYFTHGEVCELCSEKKSFLPSIKRGCYRDNQMATCAVVIMLKIHQILRTWHKKVDLFVTLSDFAKAKFVRGGLPAEKICVKPNFIYPDPGVGLGGGGYCLYVGRLSREKGIDTLLSAWETLGTRFQLKIVGEGPMLPVIHEMAMKNSSISILGRMTIEKVYDLIGDASLVIFPSKCYETFGRVAAESFAKGTPVIVVNHGATSEIVDDGRNGYHFKPNSPLDLALKVETAMSDSSKLLSMRKEARREFEQNYTAEKNYNKVMEIYSEAISRSRCR